MKQGIEATWTGGLAFETEISGRSLRMDASPADGGEGSGASPKPLLLAALAGCSGAEVVSILRKMREPLSSLSIGVEGELSDDLPSRYVAYKVVFAFKAADGLDPAKVRRAVELSMEKYCGVAAALAASGDLGWDIVFG